VPGYLRITNKTRPAWRFTARAAFPKRDAVYPEWHGWHAARRGLGSNLYRLGVPDMVIQRILRHANVSTTATYYIKTAAADVQSAMAKLESSIPAAAPNTLSDTYGTVNLETAAPHSAIQ